MRQGLAIALMAGAALAGPAAAEMGDASLTPVQRKAVAASGLPKGAIISVKPDMVVAIRNRGAPSAGGGVIEGVTLQGEVTSPVAAQFLGYQSMRSTVNVDCVRRRDLVVKMTVFSEPRGKGVAVNRHVPGGWVQPSPDAYLADVIRSVCGSVPRMAAAPAAPPLGAIEPEIEEERPLRTSIDARAERGRAVIAAAPPLVPTAPPRAQVIEDPPPAPPPQVVAEAAPAPPPAPVKPPAAKPAPPRPAKPGKVAVQVAAADSERQAKEALAKLRGKIKPPLSTQVTPVVVDGRTFHRALVVGFQTRAEAQAFCAPLKGGCFIR